MSTEFSDDRPSLPPSRETSPWVIVGIIAAVSLASILFIGGVVTSLAISGSPMKIATKDRRVLVTASDVQEVLFEEFVVRNDAEIITKTRYSDESVLLDYSYEHPQNDLQLLVISQVGCYASKKEAKQAFETLDWATHSMGSGNLESQNWFEAGQESRLATVVENGEVVGNYFACRAGKKTLMLQIYGVGFNSAGPLDQLVRPVLNALEVYDP